jgi:hypothetical protein
MLEELRLNPRSPEARSWSRVLGGRALTEEDRLDPSLSTRFAEGRRLRSTAEGTRTEATSSAVRGCEKEEVG